MIPHELEAVLAHARQIMADVSVEVGAIRQVIGTLVAELQTQQEVDAALRRLKGPD